LCLKIYIESAIWDFHMASFQIWMLQLPTNTEFFTWYHVGILQSVKFLLEAVIFLVGSSLTTLHPTKPTVKLIIWKRFTGKKCLIVSRLLTFV
jgi:hypothetical protein